ncbi:MAG: 2-succinyl-5-enolpyruvyl-6-hydroxy-3-cyclohexene-1-carboxylic-acid synthase [Nocardioidaceae bacterium]|nr:MAG: 2-succinyl-5-enolpyruvyl-6-hydroxy-3-cyclohexene-1-carboxylic-acid synthase [Nocardioidaceae bacterium]
MDNDSTRLARAVIDALVTGGVEHIVLCPGSRSAPLAFAAYSASVHLHTRIDERSAAFLALGLAKGSRRPVAIITTSGTATANLHPAMLEAHHTGLPLIALTADRPAELRGTNANQTTDQAGLYGSAALCADVEVGDIEAARAAVAAALAGQGPYQVNLQFAEPLLPGDQWSGTRPPVPPTSDWQPGPMTGPAATSSMVDSLTDRSGSDSRGGTCLPALTVVVAGDDSGPQARRLAQANGWPLLAEPSSGSRTGAHAIRTYRLLLEGPVWEQIEAVVVCGHPTLSRPVGNLISRDDVPVYAVPGPLGPTDPGRVARPLPDGARCDDPDPDWLRRWQERDQEVTAAIDAYLAGVPELTSYEVASQVAAAVPAGGLLFVGASNSVRDLDLMMPPFPVGEHRMVMANRGLAGIDGTISSAIGVALGRPWSSRSIALVGDVTFLHDSNGLQLGPGEERPDLTLVVVNDDGGSIFASLEQGAPEYEAGYDKLFGTPHNVDLEALCRAHGVPHRQVHGLASLQEALANPQGGVEMIEAVVRRDNRRALDAALRDLGHRRPKG